MTSKIRSNSCMKSKKSLINQREVHRDTLSFNDALRSALREDPDVILVGEMRDLETIRLALTAAENRPSRLWNLAYDFSSQNYRSHYRCLSGG